MISIPGVGNVAGLRARVLFYTAILEAYERQKGYCMACGEGPLEQFITHHVKPRSYGGGDETSNLEIVCSNTCHGKRENRSEAMNRHLRRNL